MKGLCHCLMAFLFILTCGCKDDKELDQIINSKPNIVTVQTDSTGVFMVQLIGQIDLPQQDYSDFKVGFDYCLNKSFSTIGTTRLEVAKINPDNTFSVTLNNCSPGQRYYYRTFITYQDQTIYGDTLSFVTQDVKLITGIIDSTLTVTSTVNVEQMSSHQVQYGICYASKNDTPTVNDNYQVTTKADNNQYTIQFEKLPFDTLYYRSFIIIDGSIAYYGNINCLLDEIEISDYDLTQLEINISYKTIRPYSVITKGVCYGPQKCPDINCYTAFLSTEESMDSINHPLFVYPYETGHIYYRGCIMVDDTIIYGPIKQIELDPKNLYVDLGLSVKWAVSNLGATKTFDRGDYYAWGETVPKTVFTAENYSQSKNYSSTGKTVLDLEDDAAFVNWGGNWRMPSQGECEELKNQCSISLYNYNENLCIIKSNIEGYNNRFIIVPTYSIKYWGPYYLFWTSSYSVAAVRNSYSIYTSLNSYNGLPIRPVLSSESFKITPTLNIDSTTITTDSYLQLRASLLKGGSNYEYWTDSIVWSSDDPDIAFVNQKGTVKGVSVGNTIIKATFRDQSSACLVTVKEYEPNFECVDLGLSVKWATCNIGAEKPTDFGRYYSWGETNTKTDYSWSSYLYYQDEYTMTKYTRNDNILTLEPEDDVANVVLGGKWRIPTIQEINELRNNCTLTMDTIKGVSGYTVKSLKKGFENKSIFLPAAGHIWSDEFTNSFNYWSSTFCSNYSYDNDAFGFTQRYSRCAGLPVRPVCSFDETGVVEYSLNVDTITVATNEQFNLYFVFKNQFGTIISIDNDDGVIWSTSDAQIASVNGGIVETHQLGNCLITAIQGSFKSTCFVRVVDSSFFKPEFVDLGLSVKWGTFNIGAYRPYMKGELYAWGETKTKTDYSWFTYAHSSGNMVYMSYSEYSTLTKYCNDSQKGYNGYTDYKYTLDPVDDVAHVKWGGEWRMPTSGEMLELISNCNWYYSTQNEVSGYLIISKIPGYEENSIFLPEYCYWSSSLCREGDVNYYPEKYYPEYAVYLSLGINNYIDIVGKRGQYKRNEGLCIRPVHP